MGERKRLGTERILSRSAMPDETKAAPLGPGLTPGTGGEGAVAEGEEGLREKLLPVRMGRGLGSLAVAMPSR